LRSAKGGERESLAEINDAVLHGTAGCVDADPAASARLSPERHRCVSGIGTIVTW
jgi:hypothetical protein